MNITRNLLTAALMTVVTTVLWAHLSAAIPLPQVVFPHQANGSLTRERVARRSSLSPASRPGYFRSGPRRRTSTTSQSGGTQRGPTKVNDRRGHATCSGAHVYPTDRCRSTS